MRERTSEDHYNLEGAQFLLNESSGDIEWEKTSIEMYHKVGADNEMACSCKFQLFRTWFVGCGKALMQK